MLRFQGVIRKIMTTSVSEYCKLVFDISQQLRERDVEALEYIYKVNSVEKATTSLGVLKKLESRGIFSSSNIQGLKAMLRTIDRCDLLDLLRGVEDRRLELCYMQALSLEEKIEAILGKMAVFCEKQNCSPTERSFCSHLRDDMRFMQKDMKEYLIKPLGEVCKSAAGEWLASSWWLALIKATELWEAVAYLAFIAKNNVQLCLLCWQPLGVQAF